MAYTPNEVKQREGMRAKALSEMRNTISLWYWVSRILYRGRAWVRSNWRWEALSSFRSGHPGTTPDVYSQDGNKTKGTG
jgi:hypothetical protein